MQQFVVPQFIDIENRIFGPVTVRQFIIMLVAALFIFISYKISDFTLFVVESIIIVLVFGLFAFFKVNGQPLHYFMLNFTSTLTKPKLRIWRKKIPKGKIEAKIPEKVAEVKHLVRRRPMISSTRLEELALIIDTGGVYQGEE
jgi:hypothetical protein